MFSILNKYGIVKYTKQYRQKKAAMANGCTLDCMLV